MRIKFGIRDTQQAVLQSEQILAPIRNAFPSASVELVTMDLAGHHLHQAEELEHALLDGRMDFVIHPLDAVPASTPSDLPLVAYARREAPKYAMVLADHGKKLSKAKPIGCFSPLHQLQVQALYPKAIVTLIKDSVEKGLEQLHTGVCGALVLEAAHVHSYHLEEHVYHWFTPEELVPAAGQGILAVQTRRGTDCACLKVVNDLETAYCALAERAFFLAANGDPTLTAAYARLDGGLLVLTGFTAKAGQTPKKGDIFGNPQQAAMLGEMLAQHLY